jgi:hypothetical protein
MSETPLANEGAVAVAPPATTPKVVKKPKTPKSPSTLPSHPPYQTMIVNAINQMKEIKGSSRFAIYKAIAAKYNLNPKVVSLRGNKALAVLLKAGTVKIGKSKKKKSIFRIQYLNSLYIFY